MSNAINFQKTYTIAWLTPAGRFGFTKIRFPAGERASAEEAASHFLDAIRGVDPQVPADAGIGTVQPVVPTVEEVLASCEQIGVRHHDQQPMLLFPAGEDKLMLPREDLGALLEAAYDSGNPDWPTTIFVEVKR